MTDLTTTFSALGDPTRFAIVERLLRDGEQSAGALTRQVALSAPAVSRHLKVLREAGIVDQRVERQKRIYSVRPQALQTVNNWTLNHREFWQTSLDRLEMALNEEMKRR